MAEEEQEQTTTRRPPDRPSIEIEIEIETEIETVLFVITETTTEKTKQTDQKEAHEMTVMIFLPRLHRVLAVAVEEEIATETVIEIVTALDQEMKNPQLITARQIDRPVEVRVEEVVDKEEVDIISITVVVVVDTDTMVVGGKMKR